MHRLVLVGGAAPIVDVPAPAVPGDGPQRPVDAAPVEPVRAPVGDAAAATLPQRPGADEPLVATAGAHRRRLQLAVEMRGRRPRSRQLGGEEQRTRARPRRRQRRGLAARVEGRDLIGLAVVGLDRDRPGDGIEPPADQGPGIRGQRALGDRLLAPAAGTRPRSRARPSASRTSAQPSAPSCPQLASRARRAPPCAPGASQTQVLTVIPSVGRRAASCGTSTAEPVRTGCNRAGPMRSVSIPAGSRPGRRTTVDANSAALETITRRRSPGRAERRSAYPTRRSQSAAGVNRVRPAGWR